MTLVRNLAAGLLIFGLTAAPAAAQDITKGLVLGFDGAKLTSPPAGTDVSMKSGLLVGAYVNMALTNSIGLTIEAEYVQKHAKATTGATASAIKVDYLSVPVLVRIPLFSGFYTLDGAAIDYPLQARTETEGTLKATDFRDKTTKPDVGFVISVGRAIGTPNVMIEARYEGGLRKLSNVDADPSQKTQVAAIVLRASF